MTKVEMRIAIAKDVISSLKILNVVEGSFIEEHNSWGDISYDDRVLKLKGISKLKDSRIQAQQLKESCEVCALGACFLSSVKLNNKFKFKFSRQDPGSFSIQIKPLFEKLKQYFTVEQIFMIENSFEMGAGFLSDWDNVKKLKTFLKKASFDRLYKKYYWDAVHFGNKYYTEPDKRLEAIMKNIVKNKGLFVLPKVDLKYNTYYQQHLEDNARIEAAWAS